MKLSYSLLFLIFLAFSCGSNEEEFAEDTDITLNFIHYWEDEEITATDYNSIQYVNASYNELGINDIRYLISDIYVKNSNDIIFSLKDYLLINPKENQNTTYSTTNFLIEDTYTLYFQFGFADEDNISNAYEDLNTENLNLDESYGGGYYFMQLNGQYKNSEDIVTDYNYHMIRATKIIDTETFELEDTSFLVTAGEFTLEGTSIILDIKVDLAEWFTDTNDWDLNIFNTNLLQNYEAQIDMTQNGDSVFSIIEEEE